MATFLVMLGPPGAGKGTQAKHLAKELKLAHISTGDIFRQHLEMQTELGQEARRYMDNGELVPDDVTIAMIKDRLSRPDCDTGAILDGYPRTIPQAKGLEDILAERAEQLQAVICLDVPARELIRRLTGRLVCREQGHIYHEISKPPKSPGICDIDGSALYQRDDDKEETVRHRIKVYQEQTAPLVDYYQAEDLLVVIEGNRPVDEVTQALLDAIQQEA